MILKTLHPDRDESLYREAWAWRSTYPKSVQQWDMVKGFDEWMQMMARRISIAAIDGNMLALVTLEPKGSDTYEVHLDCERRPNIEKLLWALLSIQRQMFEELNAKEVFAGVLRRNVGVIRIAKALGYLPDGTRETRGRLTWIRLSKTRDTYDAEREEKGRDQNQQYAVGHAIGAVQHREHLRAFARS